MGNPLRHQHSLELPLLLSAVACMGKQYERVYLPFHVASGTCKENATSAGVQSVSSAQWKLLGAECFLEIWPYAQHHHHHVLCTLGWRDQHLAEELLLLCSGSWWVSPPLPSSTFKQSNMTKT